MPLCVAVTCITLLSSRTVCRVGVYLVAITVVGANESFLTPHPSHAGGSEDSKVELVWLTAAQSLVNTTKPDDNSIL
jgi:hypothetical protein